MTGRTSNAFAAVAVILLILVVGIAALYAIRAQMPSTTASSTASPTSTATLATVTSTPIETPPVKTNDPTTVVRCGTLAANSVASGAGSGPNTYELHAPGGVSVARFLWPTGQAPLGTYLCARLIPGAPMSGFDSLLRPDEPGYIAQPSAAASPEPSPDRSSVPDQVTINGRSYRIAPATAGGGTHLVRDFMPVSPPDGRPLMAFIQVVAEDGGVFPQDITVDRIWIYGPTAWDTAPAEVRRAPEAGTPPDQIVVIARDGPKWEPGIEVDVVLRLRSGAATYFLLLTSVAIERGG